MPSGAAVAEAAAGDDGGEKEGVGEGRGLVRELVVLSPSRAVLEQLGDLVHDFFFPEPVATPDSQGGNAEGVGGAGGGSWLSSAGASGRSAAETAAAPAAGSDSGTVIVGHCGGFEVQATAVEAGPAVAAIVGCACSLRRRLTAKDDWRVTMEDGSGTNGEHAAEEKAGDGLLKEEMEGGSGSKTEHMTEEKAGDGLLKEEMECGSGSKTEQVTEEKAGDGLLKEEMEGGSGSSGNHVAKEKAGDGLLEEMSQVSAVPSPGRL